MKNALLLLLAAGLPAAAACTAASAPTRSFRPAPGAPLEVVNVGPPVLGDLNADGMTDIVVPAMRDDATKEVAVFLGDGTGRFRPIRTAIGARGGGLRLALADVDNDGCIDAIVTEHDSNSALVLLGDGRGGLGLRPGLSVPIIPGASAHTHAVAAHDQNGDGNVDLLATCADANAVAVLFGDGSGNFTGAPGSPFAAGEHPYEGLCTADVNGDGRGDVIVPNLHGNTVSILLGDGHGGLVHAPGSPRAIGPRPGFVAVGHLDRDSHVDIVLTHDDDAIVTLLRGDGSGRFAAVTGSPCPLPQPAWGAAIADIDADGAADVILGGRQDRILVLRGDGTGTFAEPTSIPTSARSPGYVCVGDLNRDGKPDLVTGHFPDGEVSVLLGD